MAQIKLKRSHKVAQYSDGRTETRTTYELDGGDKPGKFSDAYFSSLVAQPPGVSWDGANKVGIRDTAAHHELVSLNQQHERARVAEAQAAREVGQVGQQIDLYTTYLAKGRPADDVGSAAYDDMATTQVKLKQRHVAAAAALSKATEALAAFEAEHADRRAELAAKLDLSDVVVLVGVRGLTDYVTLDDGTPPPTE